MTKCKYCNFDAKLYTNLTFICTMNSGSLYLMKDQTLPGRCIFAFNKHEKKLTDLSSEEFSAFMIDLKKIAEAINRLFNPDNINYLILGDKAEHLHVHVVPKYIERIEWGEYFTMDREEYSLDETEIQQTVNTIAAALSE